MLWGIRQTSGVTPAAAGRQPSVWSQVWDFQPMKSCWVHQSGASDASAPPHHQPNARPCGTHLNSLQLHFLMWKTIRSRIILILSASPNCPEVKNTHTHKTHWKLYLAWRVPATCKSRSVTRASNDRTGTQTQDCSTLPGTTALREDLWFTSQWLLRWKANYLVKLLG